MHRDFRRSVCVSSPCQPDVHSGPWSRNWCRALCQQRRQRRWRKLCGWRCLRRIRIHDSAFRGRRRSDLNQNRRFVRPDLDRGHRSRYFRCVTLGLQGLYAGNPSWPIGNHVRPRIGCRWIPRVGRISSRRRRPRVRHRPERQRRSAGIGHVRRRWPAHVHIHRSRHLSVCNPVRDQFLLRSFPNVVVPSHRQFGRKGSYGHLAALWRLECPNGDVWYIAGFENGTDFDFNDYVFLFQNVTPSGVTPEPASWMFFAAGMIALLARNRPSIEAIRCRQPRHARKMGLTILSQAPNCLYVQDHSPTGRQWRSAKSRLSQPRCFHPAIDRGMRENGD